MRASRRRQLGDRQTALAKGELPSASELALLQLTAGVILYFNIYGARIFEPDKVVWLRIFSAIAFLIWLSELVRPADKPAQMIKAVWTRLAANPLRWPAAALAVATLVSSAFSIHPPVSFWGGYDRLAGAYSTLSLMLTFLVAADVYRQADARWRWLTLLALAGSFTALYGLLQAFRLDPLPFSESDEFGIFPATSTLGNHVFLGGLLALTLPLSVVWTLIGAMRPRRDVERRPLQAGRWELWTLLLSPLALGAAILHNEAPRNASWTIYAAMPAVTSFAAIALAALAPRWPKYVAIATGLTLLLIQFASLVATQARGPWVAALIGLFTVAGSLWWQRGAAGRKTFVPLATVLVALAVVTTLAIAFGPATLRSHPVVDRATRLLEFQAGSGLARSLIWQGTFNLMAHPVQPPGSITELTQLRPLIGYGTETLRFVFNLAAPPQFQRVGAQSVALDRAHNLALDLMVSVGLIGLAIFIWLVVSVARLLNRLGPTGHEPVLVAGLAAAALAHLVETSVSLEIVATSLVWWLTLAALAGLSTEKQMNRSLLDQPRINASFQPALSLRRLAVFSLTAVFLAFALRALPAPALWWPALWSGLIVVAGLAVGSAKPKWSMSRLKGFWAGVVALVCFVTIANLSIVAADSSYQTATLRFRAGDARGGLEALQTASRLAPLQDVYYVALGLVLRSLASQPERVAAVGPSSRLSLSSDPSALMEASSQVKLRLAQEAIEWAANLRPLESGYQHALAEVARAQAQAGDLAAIERMETHYVRAMALSPSSSQLRADFANAYLRLGQIALASRYVGEAIELDRSYVWARQVAAMVAENRGDYDAALDHLAVATTHTSPQQEAGLLAEMGRLRQAGAAPACLKDGGLTDVQYDDLVRWFRPAQQSVLTKLAGRPFVELFSSRVSSDVNLTQVWSVAGGQPHHLRLEYRTELSAGETRAFIQTFDLAGQLVETLPDGAGAALPPASGWQGWGLSFTPASAALSAKISLRNAGIGSVEIARIEMDCDATNAR